MSRCFPFPPPGYEKKARPDDDDDANILKKEKHKEKKHKKDKKEREKKEKKEKRDKDKGGEKSGEKKERKRKRKDKDKDKDKNKDNEEKKGSEVKKTDGASSHYRNDEKNAPVGIQVDQTHQGGILLELEKGFGKWNGPKEIQGLDKNSFKEHKVRSSGKELGSNHGTFVEGNQKFNHIREENKMSNDQSLKVAGKHLENGFLGNFLSNEQRFVEETFRQDKVSKKRKERKDKSKHRSSNGKGDKHKDGDRERKSKSKDKKEKKEKKKMEVKMNEVSIPVQTKLIENGNNSVNIQNDRGSYPFKGSSSNNGCLGKRKEPEMNGFVHGSGSPINKLPRLLPSSNVKQNGIRDDATNPEVRFVMESEAAEHKLDGRALCSSSSVPENGSKLDTRQTANNKRAPEMLDAINNNHHEALESLSTPQSSLSIERNLESSQSAMDFARKEQGMVTDFEVKKKVLSLQPIAENGRKLESSQPCTFFPSAERKGAISKPKSGGDQEIRSNGLGVRKPDTCSNKPPPVERKLKPPHPDDKYFTELLTIPTRVEWSENHDLSWLLANDDQGEKNRRRVSKEPEEAKEVWAEAMKVESADITALPYVIPY